MTLPQTLVHYLNQIGGWLTRADDYWNAVDLSTHQPRLWSIPFIFLCCILLFGPCARIWQPTIPGRYLTLIGGLAASIAWASWIQSRNPTDWWLFTFQMATVFVFFVISSGLIRGNLNLAEPRFREGDPGAWMFPHLFHPIALIVYVGALIGWQSAAWRMHPMHEKFQKADIQLLAQLNHPTFREASKSESAPLLKNGTLKETGFWTSMSAPFTQPLIVLLPTAFILLLFPNYLERLPVLNLGIARVPLRDVALASSLFVTWMFVVLGEWYRPMAAVTVGFRQLFLSRGLTVISLVSILLAVCWRLRISYIRTVIEGDSWIVCFYILSSLTVLWCHEYWLNRSWNREILNLIEATANDDAKVKTSSRNYVVAKGHSKMGIHIHGATRLATYVGDKRHRAYEPLDLLKDLVTSIAHETDPDGHGKTLERIKVDQRRSQIGLELVRQIGLQSRNHFLYLNLGVWGIMAALFASVLQRDRAALVQCQDTPGSFDLSQSIFPPRASQGNTGQPRRKVILVAASGGGTRAALFTSSALEGLRRENQLQHVRLGSGVSGGGVALAYFATHRDELLAADPATPEGKATWGKFHQAMSAPYIMDVLRGASEIRISYQTTIGVLLSESLQRTFQPENTSARHTFADVKEMGLILNSTLCGEWPPDFRNAQNELNWDAKLSGRGDYTSSAAAGSRVIFTNLANANAFPRTSPDGGPSREYLRYVVVSDPQVPVVSAAALNANFPPVFPNGPIEIRSSNDPQLRRLWLTDGGAEENKGEIALLFALRHAIDSIPSNSAVDIPDVHILVLDASAGGVRYSHDQGIGAASSAATRLANQLGCELTQSTKSLFERLVVAKVPAGQPQPQLHSHFIPMPAVLRFNGGLGTHWMMPEYVQFSQTTVAAEQEPGVELTGKTVVALIQDLHRPTDQRETQKKDHEEFSSAQEVWKWMAADRLFPPSHFEIWKETLSRLKE